MKSWIWMTASSLSLGIGMASRHQGRCGVWVASLQLRDGLLHEVVGQMVQALGHGQTHGGAQDAAGLTRQALGGLTQQLHAGVGEQRVLAAGGS